MNTVRTVGQLDDTVSAWQFSGLRLGIQLSHSKITSQSMAKVARALQAAVVAWVGRGLPGRRPGVRPPVRFIATRLTSEGKSERELKCARRVPRPRVQIVSIFQANGTYQ